MKKNMGSADKIIRVILAALIAVLYLTGVVKGTLGLILLIVAIIFVITSLISFCPLYTIFGFNTCKKKE
jgi:hypothetical protein